MSENDQQHGRPPRIMVILRKAVLGITGFALLTHGVALYLGYAEKMTPPKWSLVIIGLFLIVEGIDRD